MQSGFDTHYLRSFYFSFTGYITFEHRRLKVYGYKNEDHQRSPQTIHCFCNLQNSLPIAWEKLRYLRNKLPAGRTRKR